MTRPRSLLLPGLFLASVLSADPVGVPPQEPEAPEAIFDQQIGDVGVVVEAEGTWTSRIAAGWGAGWNSTGLLPGLGYPTFEKAPVFTQIPDFTLRLKLLERWFLQVTYGGTVDDRGFLGGYRGLDDDPVRWVVAGTESFSVPARAGDQPSAGRRGAPAAGASFRWGDVESEFLVRYEEGSRETRTFWGTQDAATATVSLDGWIRNRFFRLPGPYPLSGVQVLVEDATGTYTVSGSTALYRQATAAEVSVDLTSGEVDLPATAGRTYLVTWSGAPLAAGLSVHPLGLTGTDAAVTGQSGHWLVLASPGTASYFELRNRYPVSKGTTGAILLEDADGAVVSGWSVSQSPLLDWFAVSGAETGPFATADGGQFRGLYPVWQSGSAAAPAAAAVLPWTFALPRAASAADINLGTDILAGSLTVSRNGVLTTAFSFDAASGKLTFPVPLFDSDRITVSYQRKTTGQKASDLTYWQGGRWAIDPTSALEWNLQGRWNLEQGRSTTEDLQSPGRFTSSVAYTGGSGPFTWSAAATAGALLADSTGHRRLVSWSDGGTVAVLDSSALRPSALPTGVTGGTEANRIVPLFRDFWSSDPLTGAPQLSAWGKAGVSAQSATEGSWQGPYLVRGDGTRTDRLVALEAPFTTTGQWSGAQVFFDSGNPRDLRSASSIEVTVRAIGANSSDKVYLQAGSLSEDYDASGLVRTVQYRSWPALAQSPGGIRRYFALPEGSSWGNDAAGDGAAGQDGTLVTFELTGTGGWTTLTNGSWTTITHQLTAAERQALSRATGWRIVIVSGAAGTPVLLTGPVVFRGATWSVRPELTLATAVQPGEEVDSSRTDGHNLAVTWSAAAAASDTWALQGKINSFRPTAFRTLKFQVKSTEAGALSLWGSPASGTALTATVPSVPGDGSWHTVALSLADRTVSFDGTNVGGLTWSGSAVPWEHLEFRWAGTAPGTGGSLRVTEVEAVDPIWEPVLNTRLEAGWRQESPWPGSDLPLVSGTSVTVKSQQSGVGASDLTWVGQATAASNLGPLKASGEARVVQEPGQLSAHGAYRTSLPLGLDHGPQLELSDQFSDEGSRAEEVRLSLPWLGTWVANASADGLPTALNRSYRLGWSVGNAPQTPALSLNARWDQTTPAGGTLGGFADTWTKSWAWLTDDGSVAPYLSLQSDAALTVPWGDWTARLSSQGQAVQSVSSGSARYTPALGWQASVGYKSPEGDWSLTPSLSRNASASWASAGVRTPAAGARDGLTWAWGQTGGVFGAPYAELATASLWDAGPTSGTVTTTAALNADRRSGSDPIDLWLPSGAGLKVTGTNAKDGTTVHTTLTTALNTQTQALNLFGSLGSVPVVPWYQTDTYTWTSTLSVTQGSLASDARTDAALSLRADLVVSPQQKISLPVAWQGSWSSDPSQTWNLAPQWTFGGPADLPIDWPRWMSPKSFQRLFLHQLTATVDAGWKPDTPVVRNFQAGWKGRLILAEKSEFDLGLRWGQQWQQTVTVFGLEASLDWILSF